MLLKRLIEKQRELDFTDEQFARLLGIPRATWQLTRTGIRPVGRRIALATKRHIPELRDLAVSFLLSDATSVAAEATVEEAVS